MLYLFKLVQTQSLVQLHDTTQMQITAVSGCLFGVGKAGTRKDLTCFSSKVLSTKLF